MGRSSPGGRGLAAAAALGLLVAAAHPSAAAGEGGAAEPPPAAPQPGDVPALVQALASDDWGTVRPAQQAIVSILKSDQASRGLAAMESAVQGTTSLQKSRMLQSIGQADNREALALVESMFSRGDKEVQVSALAVLGRLQTRDRPILSDVRRLLRGDDPDLRREAALTLGRLKDREAVPRLIRLLDADAPPGVKESVAWSLREITGKDLGSDPERWKHWLKSEIEDMERTAALNDPTRRPFLGPAVAEATSAVRGVPPLVWPAAGLTLVALLGLLAWTSSARWLRSKIAQCAARRGAYLEPAALARSFSAMDQMPDFIVYPVLTRTVIRGATEEETLALRLLEFRAFGGCVSAAQPGGPRLKSPSPRARSPLSKLPRNLLQDLAFTRSDGGRLMRALEPEDPRWRRVPSESEAREARRGLQTWRAKKAAEGRKKAAKS